MPGNEKVPLLQVKDLKTYFYTEDGVVRAVDGVDLRVYPGEIVGLVGESRMWKKRHVAFYNEIDLQARKDRYRGNLVQ